MISKYPLCFVSCNTSLCCCLQTTLGCQILCLVLVCIHLDVKVVRGAEV